MTDNNFLPSDTPAHYTVAIIGAGLSGLAAALTLRSKGVQCIVLEKESYVGGKVHTAQLGDSSKTDKLIVGCRQANVPWFDRGATIVTMDELVYEPIIRNGIDRQEIEQKLQLHTLSPAYHMSTPETQFNIYSEPLVMEEEIKHHFGEQASERFKNFRSWLHRIYIAVYPYFFRQGFSQSRFNLPRGRWLPALAQLLRLCSVRSWQWQLDDKLSHSTLAKAFSFQALFAGVTPRTAYSVYMMIAYMDTMLGVYYPEQGMSAIPETYCHYLSQLGGIVRTNTPVTQLAPRHDALGWTIATHQQTYHADAVIAAVSDDIFHCLYHNESSVLQRLRTIPPRPRYSPSAVVIHYLIPSEAIADNLPHHHTISVGSQWDEAFEELLTGKNKGMMTDPSMLITRHSAQISAETSMYMDREVISVLIPCSNLDIADPHWETIIDSYSEKIREELINRGYTFFSSAQRIAYDHPGTWLAAGDTAGTPFSRAHLLRQTGPLRAGMKVSQAQGLYRTGADTVPGIGIPSVISSGMMAAQAVHKYLVKNRVI